MPFLKLVVNVKSCDSNCTDFSLSYRVKIWNTYKSIIRESFRNHGIPRATLQDRLKGRIANKPRRMDPDPDPVKKELIATVVKKRDIVIPFFKDGNPCQK